MRVCTNRSRDTVGASLCVSGGCVFATVSYTHLYGHERRTAEYCGQVAIVFAPLNREKGGADQTALGARQSAVAKRVCRVAFVLRPFLLRDSTVTLPCCSTYVSAEASAADVEAALEGLEPTGDLTVTRGENDENGYDWQVHRKKHRKKHWQRLVAYRKRMG